MPATIGYGTFLIPRTSGTPIYFDCVQTEEVTRDAEITQFPVEVGANITDHYRVKLAEVMLEVFVSQEPIQPGIHPEGGGFFGALTLSLPAYPKPSDLNQIVSAVGNPVGFASSALGSLINPAPTRVTVNVLQWANPFDSLQSLLTALDAIRASAGLVDVFTRSQFYPGFVLGQVKTHRDKETGTGTRVMIELKPVVFVSTSLVAAPPVPVQPKDAPPVAKGAQQPQDPGQMQSAASALLSGIFGGP